MSNLNKNILSVAAVSAEINAELNDIQLTTCTENRIGAMCDERLLLVGDVFYDDEIAGLIIPWLEKLRMSRKEILIGDPGRHGLTLDRQRLLTKLATYELPENACIENHGFKFVNVWKFK